MKIYTYKNSTQLKDSIFWNEIKDIPHFCATEVLSIGMRKFYGRNTFPCISTMDVLTKVLYPNWMKSYSDIERYKDISNIINELDNSNIKYLKQAFLKNKRSILESCKYLIESENLLLESGFNNEVFNKLTSTSETQKVFKEEVLKKLLKKIYFDGNKDYWKPEWIDSLWTKTNISEAIHKCIINEIRNIIKNCEQDDISAYYDEERVFEIFNELFDECGIFNPSEKALERWNCKSKEVLLNKIDYSPEEIEHIRKQATIEHKSYNTIVVHGVYRLNPIHIRLLKELEMHFEVIILNCYNEEFNNIYGFWNDFYDNLIRIFKIPEKNIKIDNNDCTNHREVGIAFGSVANGIINESHKFFRIHRNEFSPNLNLNVESIDEIFNGNNQIKVKGILNKSEDIVKNCKYDDERKDKISLLNILREMEIKLCNKGKILIKYDSTMQFVNKVSNIFDDTKNEKGIRSVAKMKEQFYGSKGTDMNSIFQVFYPDEFGVKPFLSYPIGQFIYAIHSMWDVKNQQLMLNSRDLAECLNLDAWHDIHPLEIFDKLRLYIGIDKVTDGMKVNDFINQVEKIIDFKEKNKNRISNLDNLSYFNLSIDEYKRFVQVIKNIDEIANKVFYNKSCTGKKHFIDLLQILNDEKSWKPLLKEEKRLMDEIKDKINNIDDEINKTDLDTIKDTMAYYLDNKEGTNINWLVRDFDQLEGDILSEAANYKNNKLKEKCYHFAMLSNENMIDNNLEDLPWPLNNDFIVSKDISFLINTIYKNNVLYKRCLLFQGIYYLLNNPIISLKLSYIENQGDCKHTPYYILDMIMNVGKDLDESNCENTKKITDIVGNKSVYKFKVDNLWDDEAVEKFSCCPYKFMHGYIVNNKNEYYKNEIQVKMYLGEVIKKYIVKMWNNILESNPDLPLDQKRNLLEKWVDGEKINIHPKSLPEVLEVIYGNCFLHSEVIKMIKDNFDYLRKNKYFIERNVPYIIDKNLYHCWIGKLTNYNLYIINKSRTINIRKRLNLLNQNDYINNYILGLNDGWHFTKNNEEVCGGYKVSEHMCLYCQYNKICCYQYRLNPIHLLRLKEDLIDKSK